MRFQASPDYTRADQGRQTHSAQGVPQPFSEAFGLDARDCDLRHSKNADDLSASGTGAILVTGCRPGTPGPEAAAPGQAAAPQAVLGLGDPEACRRARWAAMLKGSPWPPFASTAAFRTCRHSPGCPLRFVHSCRASAERHQRHNL